MDDEDGKPRETHGCTRPAIDAKGFGNYPDEQLREHGDNSLKPLSVYKLSRAEMALRRLEAALDALDVAAAGAPPPVPGEDGAWAHADEVAALRTRCAALEAAVRAASDGIDKTASRLSHLLEE